MGWLDDTDGVEVSKGQPHDSTFTVPNFYGPIGQLARVPHTSRFVATSAEKNDGGATLPGRFAIRIFDVAKPEAGATVAGLGLGAAVADLCTHQVRTGN